LRVNKREVRRFSFAHREKRRLTNLVVLAVESRSVNTRTPGIHVVTHTDRRYDQ